METYTAKVSGMGQVRWGGRLNLSGEKLRGRYPSIYSPRGGDADGAIDVYQVVGQRTSDGPFVACGWDLVVEGEFVEHFESKRDAQRYVEETLIANAYNFGNGLEARQASMQAAIDASLGKCGAVGHADAMSEAGWCPECDEGSLDSEWAARHGVEVSK